MAKATTTVSDEQQLAALREPFPFDEVSTREQGGTTLYYYEHHTIQRRLLDVFGTGLRGIRTSNIVQDETNSIAHVEVTIEVEWASGRVSCVSGWGSSAIRKMGEPYKSAYSDAIKVAASKLGCGIELYDKDYREQVKTWMDAAAKIAADKAFLTCQGCQGVIEGGEAGKKPDGTPVTLTAHEVATSTRTKFGKRLCIPCAKTAKG